MGAGKDAAIDHNAAADTCAENDPENRPETFGSAQCCFSKRAAVGVIGQQDITP